MRRFSLTDDEGFTLNALQSDANAPLFASLDEGITNSIFSAELDVNQNQHHPADAICHIFHSLSGRRG